MSVPQYLLEWARLPGPQLLLLEVRRRRERARLAQRARVQVSLTAAQRRDVGRMLPAAWAHGDDPVPLAALTKELAKHGVELDELLVALGGPLRDLPAERRAERQAKTDDKAAGLSVLAAALGEPVEALTAYDDVLRGILGGAPSWAERAREVVLVVQTAAERERRLGVLAADLYGDAHALDRKAGLGRSVARFLALRCAIAESKPWADPLSDATLWHAAWATVGVLCDQVSAQVLVLNLPLVGQAPAVRQSAATPGEPVWLSLRSLAGNFALASGVAQVFVCENPAVVEAAADHLGAQCRPLVCTFGVPNLAAMKLLAGLDTDLLVRADGDPAGWGIVEYLRQRLPRASLWRMPEDCTAYEEELLDDLLMDLSYHPTRTASGRHTWLRKSDS